MFEILDKENRFYLFFVKLIVIGLIKVNESKCIVKVDIV